MILRTVSMAMGRAARGVLVLAAVAVGWAAQMTPNVRDTLVFKDGDRVQGSLVSADAQQIVFRSDRFGELRVAAKDAVVIRAEKVAAPAPPVLAPAGAAPAPKSVAGDDSDEERMSLWDRFSPSVLTAKVRNYFGPWHGRLVFSTEAISDVADRNTSSTEAHLQRKWKTNEVQLNARYDFSNTNQVTTTDLIKFWGQWRHDFNQQLFSQYRPTAEWNRASQLRGVPNDYVLLQQEVGAGYNLVARPTRKVRVGLSQNLFDTWNTAPVSSHVSHGVVSSFEETELNLPWRITIAQRGVWYPVRGQSDGWENRIDLNKKLTETLSTSLRHEIRRNNPDGTAQDYTRLKLLFGLDF
ncbi:MAG: DUF481 domain-containing protein [Verrucomicrobiota bacterium]